jgi:hypothetical protein
MYQIIARKNGVLISFQIETLDDVKLKAMIMDIVNCDKNNYMVVTDTLDGNKIFVDKRNIVEWAFEHIVRNI